ncbi:threonine/serine exporter ThrE family protein [Corynebacterium sp. TAE3-ERU12]|uniref:threonine/serine exporter ThrE n=1 Tax=Corynebacterium sp. TAE3-ERU12 TaxID=2849491 RepID=UPI0021042CED|nr:threonine/serine exporter family protein [Corynebacterium sp. TAE3-ERU12]
MGLRKWLRGPTATVDLVRSASAPLPLAPIDYKDPNQVSDVLELAARIGGQLLACGTGNNDTVVQLRAVTAAFGLTRVQVDITLTSVTVFHLIGERRVPVTALRVVESTTVDMEKLARVDRLVRDIRGGFITLDDALCVMTDIEEAPPRYRMRVVYLAWATMAASVSLLFGSNMLVAISSFFATLAIVTAIGALALRSLPAFFLNATGGFIATTFAALCYQIGLQFDYALPPSRIIASGIIVMLAGLTLVQALQDGITGAPVTGSARFFDTMLLTGGIIVGVAMGFELLNLLNVHLPIVDAAPPIGFAQSTVKVFAGTAAAVAFAMASQANLKGLIVTGLTALLGSMLNYYLLIPMGVGPIAAAGIAATAVGLAGGLLSRRYAVPPLVTAIAGITPMLPGMSIYRGLYGMLHEQNVVGFTALFAALAAASALAAGLVLGEWMARRLRRPRMVHRAGNIMRPRIRRMRRKPPLVE